MTPPRSEGSDLIESTDGFDRADKFFCAWLSWRQARQVGDQLDWVAPLSMTDDLIEREVKLGATQKYSLPDLRDLVKRTVRLPEQRLVATYFDTPDFRLWNRHITLRHRLGDDGGIGTWTLKLPQSSSALTLDRTELEWVGDPAVIPDPVNQILQGIVRRNALHKIASLETIRRRVLLEGGKHIVLAELDDDAVTIHGGRHDGGRFRQIEIELNEADPVLLEKCVDRLCEAGVWIDDRGPKLARALDKGVAKESVNLSLGRKSTTADVVRASIQAGFNRIMDHEYLLRLEDENPPPEAIHQTRVAARRLRSDLQTFKPVLDPVWVRHVRSDLQWLGGQLGLVRDADVLGEHLDLSGLAKRGMPRARPAYENSLKVSEVSRPRRWRRSCRVSGTCFSSTNSMRRWNGPPFTFSDVMAASAQTGEPQRLFLR